jgi:hypothetical protein
MLSDRGESQLEPTVMLLGDVLQDVARGRLRVPRFQRPFVWRPEQMLDLFDSIERGFPIGSILVWETTDAVASLDEVGDVPVEPAPAGRPVSYVLDGHQRLSTLFGVLHRQGRAPRADDQREWKWRIYRDLEPKSANERYRHHRAEGSPPAPTPQNYLPVRSVNSTIDFLRFSRGLELNLGDNDRLLQLITEAERVAQRIRSYKIALIRLRGGELNEAVEVYTRLNRRGVRMEADQVVSALTHRSGRPTMSDDIETIVESVANTGFGELPRTAVFRVLLAVAGESDVMSPRWETVASRLQNRLADAIPAADQAIRAAVELFKRIGLPLANLLPYAHQLVILAGFFHRLQERGRPLTGNHEFELGRWFWVTSWAGTYAGATSTTLRRALQEMRDFADGHVYRLALDVAAVRPMPDQFNLNSARTLAYVAWEASAFPRRLNSLGEEFDVLQLLASGAPQAYRPIVPQDSRPANRLIMPTPPGVKPEAALRGLAEHPALVNRDAPVTPLEVLNSHGIPQIAWHRLLDGDYELFLKHRTDFLGGRLRDFARDMGVELTLDLVGVADDDTDHD